MPRINYDRTRTRADRMIQRWGGRAILRRSGAPDRPCYAAIVAFTPMERMGRVVNPLDRKALVSALAPDGTVLAEPVLGEDRLITLKPGTTVENENLRIVEPAGRIGPADVPVFWRLTVRA